MGKDAQAAATARMAPAPESQDDSYERFLNDLKATFNLPERLGWSSFDFEVDLFDPLIDDVLELVKEGWEKADPTRLTVRMALGLERHATLRLRDRLAGALEEVAQKGAGGRSRQLIATAVAGLEDQRVKPMLIGCLHPLYQGYIFDRMKLRLDQQREELRTMEAGLADYERFVAANDQGGLRDWLSTLGDGAVPWIERLSEHPTWRKGAISLLPSVADFASMRVANLLAKAALDEASPAPDAEILAALGRTPAPIWPILLYRARHRESGPALRLRAYAYLAGGGRWEILDDLLDELVGGGRWKEKLAEADLPRVAGFMAQLGDRRAVGRVLPFVLEEGLSATALDAVRGAFAANGWWQEIEEALRAHRGGALVYVPEGPSLADLIQDRFRKDPPKSQEAAQFRVGILNEEWNTAFHEGLEGLRPNDLAVHGPKEAALMARYGEAAKSRLADLAERGFNREEFREGIRAFEHEWMRTPAPDFDGQLPLAVIWQERKKSTPNPAYCEHQREEQLNDMYLWARRLFDDGELAAAKRELETVLAIAPDYPFARRLLACIT
jgi:hypothetical protein